MTGNEIFETALSYISQTSEESEDIAVFAPLWLNVLLAECFEVENTLRKSKGLSQLTEVPKVTAETMDIEIPYQAELVRIALPYGLASDIYRDDEDNYRVKKFRDLYISALEEATRCTMTVVEDVYGETDS